MDNSLLFIIVSVILILAVYLFSRSKQETLCISCSANKNTSLLPITNPAFNLREVAKQMILLEDHLTNKGKLCEQCIKKHSLTIEGYLEEALCLDTDKQYCDEINTTLDQFRKIEKDFVNGVDPQMLAQELRGIRKQLHVKYFNVGIKD